MRTLSWGADIKSGNLKKAMKESGRIPRGPTHPPLPSQYQRKLKKGICFKWFENDVVIHTENIKNLKLHEKLYLNLTLPQDKRGGQRTIEERYFPFEE